MMALPAENSTPIGMFPDRYIWSQGCVKVVSWGEWGRLWPTRRCGWRDERRQLSST